MAGKTYNFRKVTASWGAIIFSGFAKDGDAIAVEYDEDHFTKDVGVDGEVAWSQNSNYTGKITIRLQQSSITNDALSIAAQLDRADGSAVQPFLIKDINGTTLVATGQARIQKLPGPTYGKDLAVRQWIFDTAQMTIFTGGIPA